MEVLVQPLQRTINVRPGANLLEALRDAQIPMSYSCMAGRCGTCRVRVESGAEQLSAATQTERDTLERLGAGVRQRLACQASVNGPGVAVTRVLPSYADASAARAPQEWVAP